MATAIQTNSLTKKYGALMAVNNVTISIEQGAIVGLVGKNGAGKTTLMRLLTGLVQPTYGTVSVLPDTVRSETSVAAIVEKPSIYLNLSAADNLRAQCMLLGISVDETFLKMTLNMVGLEDTSQKAKTFSLGMKQRLAIAMTFVGKPRLLVLDEPINGLDPQGIHDIRQALLRLNSELGTTIIVSGHLLSELSKLATEYYFMDKGKVIEHTTAEELSKLPARRLRLTVSDVEKAKEVLQRYGEINISENVVELFADIPSTRALLTLSQAGVTVFDVQTIGENLEQYFLKLIGGAK